MIRLDAELRVVGCMSGHSNEYEEALTLFLLGCMSITVIKSIPDYLGRRGIIKMVKMMSLF